MVNVSAFTAGKENEEGKGGNETLSTNLGEQKKKRIQRAAKAEPLCI
jgi:hypothetical protein